MVKASSASNAAVGRFSALAKASIIKESRLDKASRFRKLAAKLNKDETANLVCKIIKSNPASTTEVWATLRDNGYVTAESPEEHIKNEMEANAGQSSGMARPVDEDGTEDASLLEDNPRTNKRAIEDLTNNDCTIVLNKFEPSAFGIGNLNRIIIRGKRQQTVET